MIVDLFCHDSRSRLPRKTLFRCAWPHMIVGFYTSLLIVVLIYHDLSYRDSRSFFDPT
jgi:hypothetical protein